MIWANDVAGQATGKDTQAGGVLLAESLWLTWCLWLVMDNFNMISNDVLREFWS